MEWNEGILLPNRMYLKSKTIQTTSRYDQSNQNIHVINRHSKVVQTTINSIARHQPSSNKEEDRTYRQQSKRPKKKAWSVVQKDDTNIISFPWTDVIPVRNESIKELAQHCVREGMGGVFVKHFRKAGGTALYYPLRTTCHRGIPTYGSELPFFNMETFHVLGTSVFVTSLRHPMDRILSLYWFEGRWPRTCGFQCETNKVKNDTTKVADLQEWMEHIHDQTNHQNLSYFRHNACGQWISVENYYIRQLLGIDRATTTMMTTQETAEKRLSGRGFRNVTLTRQHLKRAKEILASFDLVLIQEQMLANDSDMLRMFHSIIGTNEENELKQIRKGEERERYFQPPTEFEVARLQEWNALDIELYDFAVQLSAWTVNRWKQRQGGKSRSFNSSLCQKPASILDANLAEVALGGEGCATGTTSYFQRCLQHTLDPSWYEN